MAPRPVETCKRRRASLKGKSRDVGYLGFKTDASGLALSRWPHVPQVLVVFFSMCTFHETVASPGPTPQTTGGSALTTGSIMSDPDRHQIQRGKHIREAGQALVVLAVMQAAGGLLLYLDQRKDWLDRLHGLLFQGVLAGLMLGLWAWSRRYPRAALIAALVIWCVLLVAAMVLNPRTALYGGVIVAVMTLVLVRGVRAAVVEARSTRSRV